MWMVLRRSFALYLAVVAVALVGRVLLMFGTVGGMTAYTMASTADGRSMPQVIAEARAGMDTLARVLSHGQSRHEARSVLDLPQVISRGMDVSQFPRRGPGPLILTVGN